ncbi:uncharacterized protein LOC127834989 [Dreissena polymorpha]|uniref:Uncharacterized protein n=1 Tax=Dreissena polymorpha TaxID=45954 RepID=A0A9D4FZ12_DREPO|nr:uncharacterized protein LOC127834988 [Dreissena polymorpha]XP_052217121.1 uncharacterized protein LOC127834989 [Dreissena polymorpha]KAH3807655.1 hypothetical protein DPMN_136003 [Dreissena polymorpha]KAH3807656.1 hypothetical protein DPMN_136003 [Dreissena polymorpha]KAH3807687.1 hypothetical protein DPMN_136034 [Dreissena polymorpha]
MKCTGHLVFCLLIVCLSVRLSIAQGQPAKCPQNCPPQWVNLMKPYLPMIGELGPMNRLCQEANKNNIMSPCSNPGSTCTPTGNPTSFVCCPRQCLATTEKCYNQQPPPANLCVPTDVSRWQDAFIHAFMSG